jgi:alkaline phosphatase D
VRTAPRDDDPRPVRIAIGADVDPDPAFETDLVEHLIEAAPELYISLGDFPYTDNGPPAQTLAEYRERHAQLRVAPRVRELLGAVGIRAIYDDHEFRNNWDAGFVAAEASRYAAAIAAWDEFFPLGAGAPAGDVRYRRWRWGQHVECFLLDVRRFRSANSAPDDAAKTMLGAAQLAWLLDGLRASTATWKLVLTPVPLDFGSADDGWHAFRSERATIFEAVLDLPGLLFLTADQHFFASHQHAFGIREIQVGPLARGVATPDPPPPGVLFRELDYNVGLVEAHPDRLVVTGLGPGGRRFFEQAFTREQLTPRR